MKLFVTKTSLLAVPILLFLIFANYFGDAARLFDNNYERKIVEIISQGKCVTNIGNYDERIFQREAIAADFVHPETIVIGSSKLMLLNTDLLKKDDIFNHSVSGASIEDLIAIYQLYKEFEKIPRKIILGIDPWTFNKNNNQKRWRSIGTYYNHFIKSTGKENDLTFKLVQLVSLSYFQSSIKVLPGVFSGNDDPVSTLKRYNNSATRLQDGSLVYSQLQRDISTHDVESKVKLYKDGAIYGIEGFEEISPKIWHEFDLLIKDMKANGVDVEFFLTPYHPIVFQKVQRSYPMVLQTEVRIKEYAKFNQIKSYGSFDPFQIELDGSYFFDALHCREEGLKKIITAQMI